MVLDEKVKTVILTLYSEEGYTQKELAIRFGVSQSAVSQILKKHRELGTVERIKGSGRRSVIDSSISSTILRIKDESPKTSLRKMAGKVAIVANKVVSHATIRSYYNKKGIYAFYPTKKPFLKPEHVKNRLSAAKKWIQMSKDETDSIIFSDESKFNLVYNDGKSFVWRERGQALNPKYLSATLKHGGGSIMV